jgi:hypothetical protein
MLETTTVHTNPWDCSQFKDIVVWHSELDIWPLTTSLFYGSLPALG